MGGCIFIPRRSANTGSLCCTAIAKISGKLLKSKDFSSGNGQSVASSILEVLPLTKNRLCRNGANQEQGTCTKGRREVELGLPDCVGMVMGVQGRLGQQSMLCNRHRSKFPWEHAPFKSDALDHLTPSSMLFPNVLPRSISHVKSNGFCNWGYFIYLEFPHSQWRMRI